jgi:hypothetical protein
MRLYSLMLLQLLLKSPLLMLLPVAELHRVRVVVQLKC